MILLRRKYKQKPKQWGPSSTVRSVFFENLNKLGIPKPAIFFPYWEYSGQAYDLARGINTAVDPAVWGKQGLDLSASLAVHDTQYEVGQLLEYTFFAVLRKAAPTLADYVRLHYADSYSTGTVYLNTSTGQTYHRIGADSDYTFSPSINILDGGIHIITASVYSTENDFKKYYIDGKLDWHSVHSVTSNALGSDHIYYGGQPDTADRSSGCEFLLAGSWYETLSDDQVFALHDNPYFFIRRSVFRSYSIPSTISVINCNLISTSGRAIASLSGRNGLAGDLSTQPQKVISIQSGSVGINGLCDTIVPNLAPCFSGKTGSGGGISAAAGTTSLQQNGQFGQSGQLYAAINAIIHLLSGKKGQSGQIDLPILNSIPGFTGSQGTQGALSATTSLAAKLFGNNDDAAEDLIYEGTLAGAASRISGELFGKTGVDGGVVGQILVAASLAGRLGLSGAGTIRLTGAESVINGVTGVSGQVEVTLSTGMDLAGKLGLSATIAADLEPLGLQLIQIVKSEKIYQIILSTQTGQIVILSPETGKIDISTST
ncbi:hypothetical protein [uncultured Desulfobacter sp.]|uniref:hypothetical protein n=1 Tax=uncultured Desulfobacter sp. TaxID=240139 RepID=UPI002AAAD9DB|nr:hypothetical protein [uncultured Desulfobacter sp.]